MIEQNLIKTNKNLLAFSAGVDSSALFFILMNNNIEFDIAIVDYNIRAQSKEEVKYAKQLAKKYDKKIYLSSCKEDKFSEKVARDFRYNFFDNIIFEHNYESLITAHQLNDKLEWFLMQLGKGAGLVELLGMDFESKRKDYIVYKPLLNTSKDTLLEYLNKNKYKYFVDETNNQNIYKRNKIRNNFANDFLNEFENGIKKSFEYLQNDINSLNSINEIINCDDLSVAKFDTIDMNIFIRYVDQKLKEFGLIISSSTRAEIIRQKSIVISNKISIDIVENLIYMSPWDNSIMSKKFKEICRINKIPKNIRGYLFNIDKIEFDIFLKSLNKLK